MLDYPLQKLEYPLQILFHPSAVTRFVGQTGLGCPLRQPIPALVEITANSLTQSGPRFRLSIEMFTSRQVRLMIMALGLGLTLSTRGLSAADSNDNFANRIPVTGVNVTVAGTTAGATREPNEPPWPVSTAGQSIWWTWTAPMDGTLRIDTTQTNSSTALAVFQGETLADLHLVATNSYLYWTPVGPLGLRSPFNWTEVTLMRGFLQLEVAAGQSYQVAADWYSYPDLATPGTEPWGSQAAKGGPVSLTFTLTPRPVNDDFSQASTVQGAAFDLTLDNTAASLEPGEPAGLERTVWYRWTAPHSGKFTLSTNVPTAKPDPNVQTLVAGFPQPTYDDTNGWPAGMLIPLFPPSGGGQEGGGVIVIFNPGVPIGPLPWPEGYEADPPPPYVPGFSVFQGDSVDQLTLVAADDSTGTLSFQAVGGERYSIVVGGRTVTPGTVTLHGLLSYPQNDDFAASIALPGVSVTASGNLTGASPEPGEPRHWPGAVGASVWWTWQAPEDAVVDFKLTSPSAPWLHFLALYHGASISALQPVAAAAGSQILHLTRPAAAGERLDLAVDTLPGDSNDDFFLEVTAAPAPPSLISVQPQGGADSTSTLVKVGHLRGRKFVLEASTDLASWWTQFVGIVNADEATFQDFGAPHQQVRFYRVRLAEPSEAITNYPPQP